MVFGIFCLKRLKNSYHIQALGQAFWLKKALVYDFLLNTKKQSEQCCLILDIPNKCPKNIGEFFCYDISNGNYKGIDFSFDYNGKDTPRVILKGNSDDIFHIIAKFKSEVK